VTKVSGTATVIQPGINGFFVPVGDMTAMAQIIKTLDCDRTKLIKLGTEAHATIANHFSYQEYLHWFLETIERVWQQPSRSWPIKRPVIYHEWEKVSQQNLDNVPGEDIARRLSMQKIIKIIAFKVMANPSFKWLHHYRNLGKKLLGG
jgi:hypothetical protein